MKRLRSIKCPRVSLCNRFNADWRGDNSHKLNLFTAAFFKCVQSVARGTARRQHRVYQKYRFVFNTFGKLAIVFAGLQGFLVAVHSYVSHPLIKHKVAILRDKKTGMKEFRELVEEITTMMTYESMRDVKLVPVQVDTPLETTTQYKVPDESVAIVLLRPELLFPSFPQRPVVPQGVARAFACSFCRECLRADW